MRPRTRNGRHGVIVEVAADDPLQPSSLLGDRLVHSSQFVLDHPQLRFHAVPPEGLEADLERNIEDYHDRVQREVFGFARLGKQPTKIDGRCHCGFIAYETELVRAS